MLQIAKKLLDEGDCTLVVVKTAGSDGAADGCPSGRYRAVKYYQRGVADLAHLLTADPDMLTGASVADKVVGKAAASLMIEGGVREVYSRVMTRDAVAMFAAAGIPATYGELTDLVVNRAGDGRCPLDTICAPLTATAEMRAAIFAFLQKTKNKSTPQRPKPFSKN